MKLRLYSNSFNSGGERVRIALALKRIDYEYISIKDLGWDAYRAINPQLLLPTLAVGDVLVTQSTAILEYLEETAPEPALLPSNPLQRALARAFAQAVASEMHAIDVGRVRRFLGDELGLAEDRIERWSDHWMHEGFSALEALLARRPSPLAYCYGEAPGWADLFLIPQVRKGRTRFDLDVTRFPRIAEIYARCEQHPAFIAAAPEQQQDYSGPMGRSWTHEDANPIR